MEQQRLDFLGYTELETEQNEIIQYENILHDLKTSLSIIYNQILLLEKSPNMQPDSLKLVQDMKRQWFKIIKMINDVNDSRDIKNDRMQPKLRNIDIVSLISNIVDSVRLLAQKKCITILFESDEKEKVMATDREMVERILLNLLSNAIKFTLENGKIIVNLVFDQEYIHISIKDTGVGISSDEMPHIQERYYRGFTNGYIKGSGIGLTIVKQLTELLSGEFYVNRLEVGTEMVVELPCKLIYSVPVQLQLIDDFYSENIMQIELTD